MICLANSERTKSLITCTSERQTDTQTDRETEDVVEAVCGDVEEGQRVGVGVGGGAVNVNREANRMTAKQIKRNSTMK